uniref:Ig-like domain-containing protein n=1 Tax=Anas zonorhyncha TaxID=75864 RepID=A0A8B9UP50_9AVES
MPERGLPLPAHLLLLHVLPLPLLFRRWFPMGHGGRTQLRVEGPGQPVTATVGQDVVLPCHLSPQRDARSLEVRWIRDDLSETVHHYRNGEDLYREQMRAYAGRTELARDGLSAGILDLRITGLRPSDDGQYVCTVKNADAYDEATVELVPVFWFQHQPRPFGVRVGVWTSQSESP